MEVFIFNLVAYLCNWETASPGNPTCRSSSVSGGQEDLSKPLSLSLHSSPRSMPPLSFFPWLNTSPSCPPWMLGTARLDRRERRAGAEEASRLHPHPPRLAGGWLDSQEGAAGFAGKLLRDHQILGNFDDFKFRKDLLREEWWPVISYLGRILFYPFDWYQKS